MFRELLLKKKSSIVSNWIQLIIDTYSSESSKFLNLEKDQFNNPIGYTIRTNADKLFDEIVGDRNFEKINLLLEDIIKIRAIQEFSPSQAVQFIFVLKKVILLKFEEEIKEPKVFNEFLELESVIDRVALIAFNLYTDSREKLYRIRIKEIKKNSHVVSNNVNGL